MNQDPQIFQNLLKDPNYLESVDGYPPTIEKKWP